MEIKRFKRGIRLQENKKKKTKNTASTFFLRSLAEQVRRLEKKVEREKLVLASLPDLSLQIVEFAREHGRVTIGEAIKLTGVSRNTLKQHFRALAANSYLIQHGNGRGVWYELR